ncbi:MAG: NAD(P)/FAD-dependent oxidoreductase [Thaumarchaeota archaeon]|nr:NAD(P)/FAD-dependent oxidoreductase [Nitrososphaerota archaeon]
MKIAVVGIGVAGAYLLARLKDHHEVVGFERSTIENHDSICAWGTTKGPMEQFAEKCNLDFNDYLIHDGKKMYISMNSEQFTIKLMGLCTYNKIGMIKDMAKGCKINYGQAPKKEDLESEFDVIVDSTGFHRSYLPRLAQDFHLPTFQYKIEYENGVPFDDFFLKPFSSMSGYFWYFPLGKNIAHIGAGDKNRRHIEETNAFFKKYGGKIIKTVGRPIRLATPDLCEPFYSGKVVGVGESIGTVYPLLGEGIIPSMTCADIFIENLGNNERYRQQVLEKFSIYPKVLSFVRNKMDNRFGMLKNMADLISIYRYMKKNEWRFGMEIRMADMMKVARA